MNMYELKLLWLSRSDCYWWTGQNQRTFDIGMFPRCWTEPDGRRRNGVDISRPLRHSFIHTGHGSSSGPTWGSPAAIDEVYLRNPMEPMDILEMKDPSAKLMKEPRRPSALPVADVTKFKKQFNYVRLSEDAPETTDPTPNEDSLLIDLSSDTPVIIILEYIPSLFIEFESFLLFFSPSRYRN